MIRGIARLTLVFLATSIPASADWKPSKQSPPTVMREFRAAWLATVYNLDWPSRPGLSTAQQQQDLRTILDRAAEIGLNAILFQVRPASDALYRSPFEPWSSVLTGKMGQAPDPIYDPLEFATTEAHLRGLELHAWFNPFRALTSASQTASSGHVSKQHPDWTVRYGNQLWLDPGNRQVREYVRRVITDVVRRYDIDGVHIDDYFYPYPVKGKSGVPLAFSDDLAWSGYSRDGGVLSRDDWRRQNINGFVEELYRDIKSAKAHVKFGVSPFGIWRPGVPETIEAQLDAYASLYADARHWWRNGWLDYLSPQLYWSIAPAKQSFPVLLRWWADENARQRHLWPGIATERIGPDRPAQEIASQIRLTRTSSAAGGHIHWSMKSLMKNQGGIAKLLTGSVYAEQALVPPSPWLSATPPAKPSIEVTGDEKELTVSWKPGGGEPVSLWVLQWRTASGWRTRLVAGSKRSQTIAPAELSMISVSGVSRTGIQGPVAAVESKP